MSFQAALQAVARLAANMDTLAALGASVASSSGNYKVDPEISACINKVTAAFDEDLLSDITEDEADILHSRIHFVFRQALELIENPDHPATWSFEDPVILQAIGKQSRRHVDLIHGFVDSTPALSDRLSKPGRFLDVGSGTGWISMEVAARWPALHVDGIDVFAPALELASQNLAVSTVADRVTFHNADFAKLDAIETYSAAFVSSPFIPLEVVEKGIAALYRALETGGWVFMVILRAAPNPLSEALLDLRLARYGGHGWTPESTRQLMERSGFKNGTDIEPESSPMVLVAAQKI